MKCFVYILSLLLCQLGLAQNKLGAIGSWRSHYNHSSISQVVKGDQYYLAAKNEIIRIDSTQTIQSIGKAEGLHEIGIQAIAWDAQGEQLIIAYQNSTIDIKQGDQIYVINAIKNTSLYNNKNITYIKVKNDLAFIGTGFGIVVVDLKKHEIKETWINQNTDQFNIAYPVFSSLQIQSEKFKLDSVKGIAIFPDSSRWIDLEGPRHPIKGMMSILDQQLIAPFSNKVPGFCYYDDKGWHTIDNPSLPVFNLSTKSQEIQKAWLSSATALYQIDFTSGQLDSTNLEMGTGIIVDMFNANNGAQWLVQTQKGLQVINQNSWKTIGTPNNTSFTNYATMLANSKNQIWMADSKNQGLWIYQISQDSKNAGWITKTTAATNGNLPSNTVTSIIEDLSGQIWVGTDNGIGIFQCDDLINSPCNAYLPIINSNGFNAYLFQKEVIRCMAVDGANRKWIGTNNGLWLVSPDGLDIISHFTAANSPLPSDSIVQILIEPKSGEVFINTDQELVSYRGTATAGKTNQGDLFIFPNPVPPDYNGLISIKNIITDGMVKITDLDGKLIFQTRALGGQAVWNGKTYEGNSVATGIYLVFVQNNEGTENAVGKIMITKNH